MAPCEAGCVCRVGLVPLDEPLGWRLGSRRCASCGQPNELVVLHAMAIPFRTRSHFDGQAILETGIDRPVGSSDGWLNRLLQVMSGERSGIAIAAGMPRSLTGSFKVQTWSPTQLGVVDDASLERLSALYRTDTTLHGRFEARCSSRPRSAKSRWPVRTRGAAG